MSNHFHAIGFPVDREEDLDDLLAVGASEGERFPAVEGEYCRWAPGNGVELWLHFVETELISLQPHFAGDTVRPLGLTERVRREDDTVLEGGFYAWANPGQEPSDGDYPFVFYAPDFRLHDSVALPSRASVQLTAFAHVLTAYPDEADFSASQGQKEVRYSPDHFLPTGLFATGTPRAEADFAGRLLAAEARTNPHTGRRFHALKVDTFGGVVDVVVAPETVDGDLVGGCIVQGEYWLSGRILAASA